MIESDIKNIHWPYYLSFEKDIENLARYIDFDKSNYCTHSIELARILLAASSEVDVLLKEICKLIDSSKNPNNINQYSELLNQNGHEISNIGVVSKRYGLKLKPWSNWAYDKNPEWWWAYNKVKHERSNYFQQANLKNTLNSVAALLILNIEYQYQIMQSSSPGFPFELRSVVSRLYPKSELFRIDDIWAYFEE